MTAIVTPPDAAAEPLPARRPPEEKNLNKAAYQSNPEGATAKQATARPQPYSLPTPPLSHS